VPHSSVRQNVPVTEPEAATVRPPEARASTAGMTDFPLSSSIVSLLLLGSLLFGFEPGVVGVVACSLSRSLTDRAAAAWLRVSRIPAAQGVSAGCAALQSAIRLSVACTA
jgi:hypothetical protein